LALFIALVFCASLRSAQNKSLRVRLLSGLKPGPTSEAIATTEARTKTKYRGVLSFAQNDDKKTDNNKSDYGKVFMWWRRSGAGAV
jgi:hypothetical protein